LTAAVDVGEDALVRQAAVGIADGCIDREGGEFSNLIILKQRCVGVPATDVCGALPPARQGMSLAFNEVTGKITMFGGCGAGGANLDDTWDYDGVVWRDISSNPPSPFRSSECRSW
jgi:hypothetical protein